MGHHQPTGTQGLPFAIFHFLAVWKVGPNDVHCLQIRSENAAVSLCVTFVCMCDYGSSKAFWADTELPKGVGGFVSFVFIRVISSQSEMDESRTP